MKDRFDLENEITDLYNFAERLSDLNYAILELDISTDDTANALEGLSVLLKIHAQKMFDTFTQVHRLDNYCTNHD